MNKPPTNQAAAPAPTEPLTVRFVRQLPNEEVVYYARRCAQKSHYAGPLTIVLEAKPSPGKPIHEARLEQDGHVLIAESDPEILLAIRNAFDRLEMELMTVPPQLRGAAAAAAAAGTEAPKVWS